MEHRIGVLRCSMEEAERSHLRDVLLLQQPDAWCLWLVWKLVQLEGPGHGHARLQ